MKILLLVFINITSYAFGANSNKRSYSGKGKGVGKGVLKKGGDLPTCTLKFVCLAKMDASKTLSDQGTGHTQQRRSQGEEHTARC